jgi:hypothetical protein
MHTLEDSHHLVERAYLGAARHLVRAVEYEQGNAFAVDIEPDMQHDSLQKLGTPKLKPPSSTKPPARGFLHRLTPERASQRVARTLSAPLIYRARC